MRKKFKEYYGEDCSEAFIDENSMIFGWKINSYQEGFGHGFIYGAIYNNEYGGGSGSGYNDGIGGISYPVELIQYWK